ncbi:MAG TPA: VOC family protein [Candidatus Fermentibacter daniensis]|nr:VOC family protein [Candidatus Fermentibacter daniensis]HPK51283.1 VOC family protein [Candidatus Fermentibacter daniensis]
MKYICSLIVVDDVKKSRYLYETILGCKVISDFGENVAFEGSFAIHQKDHFMKLISNNPVLKKSNSSELYFEDDEIEKTEKIIEDNNFEFIHKIVEQPWKQRVLRFYDYDFNIIEIGEPLEHVAYRLYMENINIEEISKITYLTVDKINESIKYYKEKKVPTTAST